MSIKVKKATDISSKLDVRVDPTDLASPRQNNETEEPEETSRKFKTRPQTSKLNTMKKSFLRQTTYDKDIPIDLKQGRSSIRGSLDINPDIDVDDLMTEEEKK